jgi:hypothetical protein
MGTELRSVARRDATSTLPVAAKAMLAMKAPAPEKLRSFEAPFLKGNRSGKH